MQDRETVVVAGNPAGPIAWVIGIVIVVAATLFVLFYWHPWNTTSRQRRRSFSPATQRKEQFNYFERFDVERFDVDNPP